MTSLFKEVFSKKIVDFVIDQMKEQDASGLNSYKDGIFIHNFARRVFDVFVATDPREYVFCYDQTERNTKCVKFTNELMEFTRKHHKIQGYPVITIGKEQLISLK